jgi:hypothetical protein
MTGTETDPRSGSVIDAGVLNEPSLAIHARR